jgi:hypothetical protein
MQVPIDYYQLYILEQTSSSVHPFVFDDNKSDPLPTEDELARLLSLLAS